MRGKGENNIFRWATTMKSCPHFIDPPFDDVDLDIAENIGWVFCHYENICLERDRCPIIPDLPIFPRFKKEVK